MVEAYDSTGTMITSSIGAANTRSQGGTGLSCVQVASQQANISYVVLHDHGGYGLVDDITTDAPQSEPVAPEPGAMLVLGMGLVGLSAKIRVRRP